MGRKEKRKYIRQLPLRESKYVAFGSSDFSILGYLFASKLEEKFKFSLFNELNSTLYRPTVCEEWLQYS
jgi:hypothetical protein